MRRSGRKWSWMFRHTGQSISIFSALALLMSACELTCSLKTPVDAGTSLSVDSLPPIDLEREGKWTPPTSGASFGCYVSHDFKFIFVHIQKNGGSSVWKFLKKLVCLALRKRTGKEDGDCDDRHTVHPLKKRSGCLAEYPDYFSFSFSRNPWDRAVSMWSYGLKRQLTKRSRPPTPEQEDRIRKSYCAFKSFLERRKKSRRTAGSLCGYHAEVVQWQTLRKLKFIGRLERFERDIVSILERIDPSGELRKIYQTQVYIHKNKSEHRPYHAYYDAALKQLVREIWPDDVAHLGYDFITEPADEAVARTANASASNRTQI